MGQLSSNKGMTKETRRGVRSVLQVVLGQDSTIQLQSF